MDGYQKKHLQNMIELIDQYLKHKNSNIYLVVGALEGSLDAAEIQDKNFVKKWYEYWTPLEIARADNEEKMDTFFIQEKLEKLKKFLEETLTLN